MSRLIDLTGHIFNRLTVIKRVPHCTRVQWLCKCKCGKETVVAASNLRTGHTTSCGCWRKEVLPKSVTKHGYSQRNNIVAPEYNTWGNIKKRCYNKNSSMYQYYGARGITICARWKDSFTNFLVDMGDKPEPKRLYSIHRLDNDGNYSPENCIWATCHVQANNRRTNRLITYHGNTKTLINWCRHLRLPYKTIWSRIYVLGWHFRKAFETPIKHPLFPK